MSAFILVDFDGTIVRDDATDLILERFALPEWRTIEDDWTAGAIGSRECLARQIDLVRATERDLDDLIDGLEIDPAFSDFAALCQDAGFDIVIASDGLDRVIASVLTRFGFDLAYVSNRLVKTGVDRWRIDFPNFDRACGPGSGTCKCAVSGRATSPTLLVGDGRSDFCAAAQAKWVLAKGQLARHCRQSAIPHVPISGFADAIDVLRLLFPRQAAVHAGAQQDAVPAGLGHA